MEEASRKEGSKNREAEEESGRQGKELERKKLLLKGGMRKYRELEKG